VKNPDLFDNQKTHRAWQIPSFPIDVKTKIKIAAIEDNTTVPALLEKILVPWIERRERRKEAAKK